MQVRLATPLDLVLAASRPRAFNTVGTGGDDRLGKDGGVSRRLVIGTRRSRLARIQTRIVSAALAEAFPDVEIVLKEMTTRGDRITDRPLSAIGAKGFFTRAIERALLEKEIDLAVHSLKDLPVELPAGLVSAATPERGDPRDALCCRDAEGLRDLRKGAVVGTSSPRRSAQLLALRADLEIRPLRGNVDTRLEKLHRGDYDAIVVAKAALDRLGRTGEASEVLGLEDFLPAPGQGALALETREGEFDVTRLARDVNDTSTFVATAAERMLLERLGGGCHLPMGALGECTGDDLLLRAVVLAPDGTRIVRADAKGTLQNPAAVVDNCLQELERRGSTTLLAPRDADGEDPHGRTPDREALQDG